MILYYNYGNVSDFRAMRKYYHSSFILIFSKISNINGWTRDASK